MTESAVDVKESAQRGGWVCSARLHTQETKVCVPSKKPVSPVISSISWTWPKVNFFLPKLNSPGLCSMCQRLDCLIQSLVLWQVTFQVICVTLLVYWKSGLAVIPSVATWNEKQTKQRATPSLLLMIHFLVSLVELAGYPAHYYDWLDLLDFWTQQSFKKMSFCEHWIRQFQKNFHTLVGQ